MQRPRTSAWSRNAHLTDAGPQSAKRQTAARSRVSFRSVRDQAVTRIFLPLTVVVAVTLPTFAPRSGTMT
jgi:hypothetical protein